MTFFFKNGSKIGDKYKVTNTKGVHKNWDKNQPEHVLKLFLNFEKISASCSYVKLQLADSVSASGGLRNRGQIFF